MSNPEALAAMRYYRALLHSRFHPCEARRLVHSRLHRLPGGYPMRESRMPE